MQTLLGIDLGTSSIKGMLLEVESGKVTVEKVKYRVQIPQEGYAEQDPEVWWRSLQDVLRMLKKKNPGAFDSIHAISFSGQMHGLVTVDADGNPVRPAIVWLDQRSRHEVELINQKLADKEIREVLHNRIYTGFAFSSLLWIKEHEPQNYQMIHKIMQPKDYLRSRMIETICTDVTDASGTTMFHIGKRKWAWDVIRKFGLKEDIFPACSESVEIVGEVTTACAAETGLRAKIPVICGCGDQMAQSIGNGVYRPGQMISNIGTGGQISAYSDRDIYDSELRTHTFCHAISGGYSVYGATLNCGNSLNWLCHSILDANSISFEQCSQLAAEVSPGSEGVIFLPYLTGERTPVMDTNAKGILFGLTLGHDKRTLIRAVMEGMIFSLKDCLVLMEQMGLQASGEVIASGGGAGSELFLQMQADIFEKQIKVCSVGEQACLGACILAGIGSGLFDIVTACDQYVTFNKKIYTPQKENFAVYRENYKKYHLLYETTNNFM